MVTAGIPGAAGLAPSVIIHAEFSVAALEAGTDVLCEKPMAMNAAETYDRQLAAVTPP